jgi:hypothetical protein
MDTNQPPTPETHLAVLREALLDLAYDVQSYLRRHARAAVRMSAAVLIATSLAACGPSTVPGASYSTVQPLAQEVRVGLPSQPGRYPIVPGSLGRDAQGVYHFAWRRSTDSSAVQNFASASLLRLAQGATTELEIPPSGDPTLYLPPDASIPLVNSVEDLRAPGYSSVYYPTWHPFYGGYRGIGYYDPPTQTVSSGSVVNGSRVSSSPSAPSSRVVGLAKAVSGRAGGTGSGVAATNKSGATVSSTNHGGAAAAKSGGFSSGSASASSGASSS